MDAEIIPLPRRSIYRDYSDTKLLAAIKGNREMMVIAERTHERLMEEAEWRNLDV